jgi:hypothetical protein
MPKEILIAKKRSGKDIDGIALAVVAKYQSEMLTSLQPFDVQRFFECELEGETQIRPDYELLPFGAFGMTDINGMRCVICPSLLENPTGNRFLRSTIGHELGHCFLHVPEFRLRKQLAQFIHSDPSAALPRADETKVPTFMKPEWQAHHFSGALLMPRPSVEFALASGYEHAELCDIFDVNRPFVDSRLRALGILQKI